MSDINVTVTNSITKTVTVASPITKAVTVSSSAETQGISSRLIQTGSYLESLITISNAGVSSINTKSGALIITGTGSITVIPNGQTFIISGSSTTGDFYPNNNPSGYLTGFDSGLYTLNANTGSFITTGQTGSFGGGGNTGGLTGAFYPLNSNPSGYITGLNTGNFITLSQTGDFVGHGETGALLIEFVSHSETGTLTNQFTNTDYVNGVSGVIDSRLVSTGSYLFGLIQASSAGVSSLNSASGSITLNGAGNISVSTNGQTITISGNTGEYVNFITSSQTGDFVSRGETGSLTITGAGNISVTSSGETVIISGETSNLVTISQTGNLTGQFYPYNSNPSNYITTLQTGDFVGHGETGEFATTGYVSGVSGVLNVRLESTGSYLYTLIQASSAGVSSINSSSGSITINGAGNTSVSTNGQTITISGNTGAYSTFVTTSQTGDFVGHGETGALLNEFVSHSESGILTGQFYPLNSNPSNYITNSQTGDFVGHGETGVLLNEFVSHFESGILTGEFYPLKSNPSGFVTGNVVRPTETGSFLTSIPSDGVRTLNITGSTISGNLVLTGAGSLSLTLSGQTITLSGSATAINTGNFVDQGMTGRYTGEFYPLNTNPSNYVTGSVVRPSETGNFVTTNQTGDFVGHGETGVLLTEFVSHTETGILTGQFYPYNSNPLNYITSSQTGSFVSVGMTGQFVDNGMTGSFLTSTPQDGVRTLNVTGLTISGNVIFTGIGGLLITTSGNTVSFSGGGSQSGDYVLNSQTGQFVSTGMTGRLVDNGMTGSFITSIPQDGVRTLNVTGALISGSISLTGAGNITLTNNGQIITISGTSSQDAAAGVSSFNSVTGAIILTGLGALNVTNVGQTFTISESGISGKLYQKYLYIESPTNSENISWFYNKESIVLDSIISVLSGTSPTLGWTLSQSINRNQTGSLIASGYTDSVTTGNLLNSFSNQVMSGEAFILFRTQSSGGVLNNFSLTLIGQPIRLNPTDSGNFVSISQSGNFVDQGMTGKYTGEFYPYNSNPSSYVISSQTGDFVGHGETGVLLSEFVSHFETGTLTGQFYPLNTNPSNYITISQTGSFVDIGMTGNFVTITQTGSFVTTSQTGHNHDGQYYPLNSNPSGYLITKEVKSITVENPTTGDVIPIYYNPADKIITGVLSTVFTTGISPSINFKISQSLNRNGFRSDILPMTFCDNQTTGLLSPSFSNNTISGKTFVYFECTGATGVKNVHISLLF